MICGNVSWRCVLSSSLSFLSENSQILQKIAICLFKSRFARSQSDFNLRKRRLHSVITSLATLRIFEISGFSSFFGLSARTLAII